MLEWDGGAETAERTVIVFGDIKNIQLDNALQSNAVLLDFLFIDLNSALSSTDLQDLILIFICLDLFGNPDHILGF